jgi:competence protein ComEC
MFIELSKSKIFLICCIIFILGIAAASFLPVEFIQNDLWWFVGVMASVVFLVLFWKNKIIRISALTGLFLFLAFWRYAIGLPENLPDKIWYYNGETVNVISKITSEPDVRQNNVKYIVEAKMLRRDEAMPRLYGGISGKILITTNLYPQYNYGDELEIVCELQAPEPFSGFSYDRYLGRFDIYSVCYYPRLTPSSPEASGEDTPLPPPPTPPNQEGRLRRGDWGEELYKKILAIKNKLRQAIDNGLTEPEAGLARAIMLGDRRGVGQDWLDKFSQTGTTHIMAISGMNITILSALVMNFLIFLGLWRRQAFYAAVVFLVLYLFLIGFPASAARAGVMGILVMLALHLGRLNKLSNSLFFAAALLLFLNPKLLRDDAGFQLSFLAVLGIGWFYPILGKWTEKIKSRFLKAIADGLNITIAAQIFTLPLIAFSFSTVSLISPLANILILWTMAALMVVILAAFIPAIVFPEIAFLFFLPAGLLLKYTLVIVDILSKAPYAYVKVNYFWPGWIILYYGVVAYFIYWARKKDKKLDG